MQYRKALAREQAMSRDGSGVSTDLEQTQAAVCRAVQQIAVNEAQIVQAEMSVQTANANLGYTRILAPMDGEVLGIVTREGQTIVSSQIAPTILVLADLDKVQVKPAFPKPISRKSIRDSRYGFTSLPTRKPVMKGSLAISSRAAGGAGGTKSPARLPVTSRAAPFTIRHLRVDNRQRLLKTSMTAQVFIRIAQVKMRCACRLPRWGVRSG